MAEHERQPLLIRIRYQILADPNVRVDAFPDEQLAVFSDSLVYGNQKRNRSHVKIMLELFQTRGVQRHLQPFAQPVKLLLDAVEHGFRNRFLLAFVLQRELDDRNRSFHLVNPPACKRGLMLALLAVAIQLRLVQPVSRFEKLMQSQSQRGFPCRLQ
ncbi:hypothetical protein D3C76_1148950 [compost metagenome]